MKTIISHHGPLTVTDAQFEALAAKYDQSRDGAAHFGEFCQRAYADTLLGCIMVPWCGMLLGIERDGYTHS